MAPQGGHTAWDHEDGPSDEVRQAEEGVLAHSTKKLIIFRSIYAKTSPACLPVGRAVPGRRGVTPHHTHMPMPISSAAGGSPHPPVMQLAGWRAPRSTTKGRAAPQHCRLPAPLPTTHLLYSCRGEDGHEGKGKEHAPVLLGVGGDAQHPRSASAAAAAPMQLFVAW